MDTFGFVLQFLAAAGGGSVITHILSRRKNRADAEQTEVDSASKTNDEWERLYEKVKEENALWSKKFDALEMKYNEMSANYVSLSKKLNAIANDHQIDLSKYANP